MVEGVNNIQTQNIQKKDNAVQNAAIAGGVGVVGGGTAGYMTKQIFKDDKFTDEFIKESKKQLVNTKTDDKNLRKIIINLFNMEDNPTIKSIKKFFRNNKAFFEQIDKEEFDNILKSEKKILDTFQQLKKGLNDEFSGNFDEISKFFDKNKKKFISSDKLKNNKLYQGVLKAQLKIKGKAGLIWGAATGAVLSIGTFIASKVGGNKQV